MIVEKLIDILDIKEKQAMAFCTVYKYKVKNEDLQNMIYDYCNDIVDSFLEKYKKELQDDNVVLKLRQHISNIEANHEHSGKIVYESLYKKLNKLVNKNKIV